MSRGCEAVTSVAASGQRPGRPGEGWLLSWGSYAFFPHPSHAFTSGGGKPGGRLFLSRRPHQRRSVGTGPLGTEECTVKPEGVILVLIFIQIGGPLVTHSAYGGAAAQAPSALGWLPCWPCVPEA